MMRDREPLVAIGVVSLHKPSAVKAQRQIHHTWASLMPASLVAVRFVLHCPANRLPASVAGLPHAHRILCSPVEKEHPKTLFWFERALELFPHTPWLCHADDDSYIQTRVLFAELSRYPAHNEAYGLMYHGRAWDASDDLSRTDSYVGSVVESYASPTEQIGVPAQPMSRKGVQASVIASPGLKPETQFHFPFMQGGFCARSASNPAGCDGRWLCAHSLARSLARSLTRPP